MPSAHSEAASLPVAVIGAGPVGLAAAVRLIGRGETPDGDEVTPAPVDEIDMATAMRPAATNVASSDVSPTAATFVRLLTEPTRRRIFLRLKEGELCNCEMVCTLDLPQSLIIRHLRQLHAAGFINRAAR